MVESERLVLNRESITLIVKQVAIFNFYRGIPASRLISGFGTLSLATITLESKMALHDSKCLISMIIQKNLKLWSAFQECVILVTQLQCALSRTRVNFAARFAINGILDSRFPQLKQQCAW